MPTQHKNKTFATLLAALTGALGLHRFYLFGKKDLWGWIHIVLAVSAAAAWTIWHRTVLPEVLLTPLILSALWAIIEALVLGLQSDDKWDARFNSLSGASSTSHWVLALILVLSAAVGAFGLLFLIARGMDLMFTGGSYG
jgi:TM2 domain-containing membrane protein YozV